MDFSAKLPLIMTTAQGEEALLLPGYVVCCFIFSLYVIDSQTSITHISQPCWDGWRYITLNKLDKSIILKKTSILICLFQPFIVAFDTHNLADKLLYIQNLSRTAIRLNSEQFLLRPLVCTNEIKVIIS